MSTEERKRGRGRPSKGRPERISVAFSTTRLEALTEAALDAGASVVDIINNMLDRAGVTK